MSAWRRLYEESCSEIIMHRYLRSFQSLFSAPGIIVAAVVVACAATAWKRNRSSTSWEESQCNPSRSYCATVMRQRSWSGEQTASAKVTVFVVLNKEGCPSTPQSFQPTILIMRASGPGDVSVRWKDNQTLTIGCQNCRLAYEELGRHRTHIDSIHVLYEGFEHIH